MCMARSVVLTVGTIKFLFLRWSICHALLFAFASFTSAAWAGIRFNSLAGEIANPAESVYTGERGREEDERNKSIDGGVIRHVSGSLI